MNRPLMMFVAGHGLAMKMQAANQFAGGHPGEASAAVNPNCPAQTRAFHEDFLGLRLVNPLEIHVTRTGCLGARLHTFFGMADGSFELASKRDGHDDATDPARNQARSKLDRWTARRARQAG